MLYLGGISDFEETGSSVEDCAVLAMVVVRRRCGGGTTAYQWACPPWLRCRSG